jgi:hypothetical protein
MSEVGSQNQKSEDYRQVVHDFDICNLFPEVSEDYLQCYQLLAFHQMSLAVVLDLP